MTMLFLMCFLIINTALVVVYAIVRLVRHDNIGMVLFFIFLPGIGFIVYFVPTLIQRLLKNTGIDREAILTHAFDIDLQPEHPDVDDALNVVPIEDAMSVSGNAEKRALLLRQLKKGLKENYKIVLAAEQDEDSESVHYVASAKTEIYGMLQTQWLECRRELEEAPDDPEKFHQALDVLIEMLDSDVLSEREQNAYRKRLCRLVQWKIDADERIVFPEEYERYLRSLVELGRYADAEDLWHMYADKMRSEAAYHDMLQMFYQKKERDKFEETLDDLRKNRQIRLSPQGLGRLRYWTARLKGVPIED